MGSKLNLVGQRFGKLVVVKEYGKIGNTYAWECLCDCGNTKVVKGGYLKSGNNRSCGCLHKEVITKHGMWKSREFTCWSSARGRCFNKNDKNYPRYGGIGITMCEEWRDDFLAFYNYVGKMPDYDQHWSCGRIDNTRGYEPGNVRWELPDTQSKNRGLLSCNNTGINGITLYSRISNENGKEYSYVCATATLEKRRQVSKSFSLLRMTYEDAIAKAIEWRAEMLKKAEELGTFYAPTHGLPKVAIND